MWNFQKGTAAVVVVGVEVVAAEAAMTALTEIVVRMVVITVVAEDVAEGNPGEMDRHCGAVAYHLDGLAQNCGKILE